MKLSMTRQRIARLRDLAEQHEDADRALLLNVASFFEQMFTAGADLEDVPEEDRDRISVGLRAHPVQHPETEGED